MIHVKITPDPIDIEALIAQVTDQRNGAIVTFIGSVREVNDGRSVQELQYDAYETMAQRELETIVEEASRQFGTSDIAAEHRIGTLALGETCVVIAAAHAHRASAFDACRYVIEELKRRVPIWKREQYADGSNVWIDPAQLSQ
jgi:molybdopterin synthase catalytic subunit